MSRNKSFSKSEAIEETAVEETVEPTETEETVEALPEETKCATIRNNSARAITLTGSRNPDDKVTIIPTEIVTIKPALWAMLCANAAVKTFFDSGELVEVK